MLRRSFGSGNDALPTHGNATGSSTSYTASGGFGGYRDYNGSAKYSKRYSGVGGKSTLTYAAIGLAVFNVILTGLWMRSRGGYRSLLTTLNVKDVAGAISKIEWTEKQVAKVRHEISSEERLAETRYGPRIKQLEKDNKRWKSERDDLRVRYESPQKKKDDTRLKQREVAHLEQIEQMQRAIRKESKRTVLERFGPGPHEVQMTFMHSEIDYDFVIELAPLHTVPHAIHLFLEQVEHGLWTGNYFHTNSKHRLQAGPSISFSAAVKENTTENLNRKRFTDLQLDQLAFPDYSHEFVHHAWTVAFSSRPGGPDIYINKKDNVVLHGPGGQIQHALQEQGDSCFGRITKGKEHIESILFPLETGNPHSISMKKPVPIVRATILTPKPKAGTQMNLEEIAEPKEFQFGRSLKDALEPYQQSLLENVKIEVQVPNDIPLNNTSPNEFPNEFPLINNTSSNQVPLNTS